MKKILFAALMLVQSASHATSLRNVRLELRSTPIGISTDSQTTLIQIYADGEVRGYTCLKAYKPGPGVTGPRCLRSKTIASLSAYEMDAIERLIDTAAESRIVNPDPTQPRCLAMPVASVAYTANNGRLLLKQGAYPCGGMSYNPSSAAKNLVERLDRFHRLFQMNGYAE